MAESEEPVLFDGSRGAWDSTLMELEGETVKRIDIRNVSDKAEAVATAAARTGLGGNGDKEMTSTAAAQAWLVIRRRKQQDKILIRQHQQKDSSN